MFKAFLKFCIRGRCVLIAAHNKLLLLNDESLCAGNRTFISI